MRRDEVDPDIEDWHINASAWDAVATARDQLEIGQRPRRNRFDWTQFPGEGPDHHLFGDVAGCRVLEVGCGDGDALAFLVAQGATGVGIDCSVRQIHRAESRWLREFPDSIRFMHGDAIGVLETFDANCMDMAYSIFGAIGHAHPNRLLSLLHTVLKPEGRLLFALRHPEWPSPREQHSSADGPTNADPRRRLVSLPLTSDSLSTIVRYVCIKADWRRICIEAGFRIHEIQELHVDPSHMAHWYVGEELHAMTAAARSCPCCLLVAASKA